MATYEDDLRALDLFTPHVTGKIVFFDTETNGLSPTSSVLSISALKYDYETDDQKVKLTKCDSFERYYFSKEEPNKIALECNGLTEEKLIELRKDSIYPKYQIEDSSFKTFCEDADLFVAHNISFDKKFFDFMKDKKTFCTMRSSTNEVKAKFPSGKSGYKTPTLKEASLYYGIDFKDEDAHASSYDTLKCFEIFEKMIENFKVNYKLNMA